ncbi:NUDIX hydrolase [Nocardioides coralli]|uniref:NUDIX hydrolase n=1 Tax=Nocardioides coralli TaxID=2872154 RepID=UPI001CA3E57D|nr:NUDIX hydrolase [Nocardioides coralli]QZY30227.1 NUDIX hydrolase [Nocardioides coralli]
MSDQPTLTDGTVTLRPWTDADVAAGVAGHDEEIAQWFGSEHASPTEAEQRDAIRRWRQGWEDGTTVNFLVEAEGAVVGNVEVRVKDDHIGELSWTLYAGHRGRGYGVRAVRMLVDWAVDQLGLVRIEAYVNTANERSKRLATRAGLQREGVMRGREVLRGDRHDTVLFARLASDPPITEPGGFRALLNSFLPRKRGISQLLVRDPADRVLLCQLTYKRDWDLPGGVVEVGESPQRAVSREVAEELALDLPAGRLLLTDWLPPWGGWDDALCLVFDGGVHDPSLLDAVVKETREIRAAEFCTMEQVVERCADFTARRVAAALANVHDGGPAYAESGRSPDTP